MKRIYSIVITLLLMLTLSSCGTKDECVQEVVEKEVIKYVDKIVEKEVIKEVPVYVETPLEVERERKYEPGTYFKSVKTAEGTLMALVVIDNYGRLSGIHLDNTSSMTKYYIDEAENKLYVYVEGIEDIIPNTYRLVDLAKPLPNISVNLLPLVI